MRKDVKKAVSWIEKFEKKANEEVARIRTVDEGIEGEISDLKEKITDLEGGSQVLSLVPSYVQPSFLFSSSFSLASSSHSSLACSLYLASSGLMSSSLSLAPTSRKNSIPFLVSRLLPIALPFAV